MEQKTEELEGKVDAESAENMLLGVDPTGEGAKDWTPEERAKVEDMMQMLAVVPKPPVYVVKNHFNPGDHTYDSKAKVTIMVRTVGDSALTVSAVGRKIVWKVGHTVTLSGQAFVVQKTKRNDATLVHMGPALPGYMPAAPEKLQNTTIKGGK